MSLLFFDGFEKISTAQLARRGWSIVNASAGSATIDGGGVIGNRLNCFGQSAGVFAAESHAYKGFVATPQVFGGFDFQRAASSASDSIFLRIAEGGTTHVFFTCGETGIISAFKGDGTLLAQSSTFAIIEGDWHFVEFDITIDNAAGSARIVVDSVEAINVTGVDTRNGGAVGTADRIYLCCSTGGFPNANRHYFDNLYVGDPYGTGLIELAGPVRVDVLTPNANDSVAFTPSAGANYENIDDATPDDDGTYNETLSDGVADDFTLPSLPDDSLTIYAVQVRSVAARNGAGVAAIANRLISGATTDVSASESLAGSYEELTTLFELNPDGDVEWDDDAIDALKVGYERP